jgi:hypothetical protein
MACKFIRVSLPPDINERERDRTARVKWVCTVKLVGAEAAVDGQAARARLALTEDLSGTNKRSVQHGHDWEVERDGDFLYV